MITAESLIAKFRYALDNNWGYIWGKAGVLWTESMQKNATDESAKKYGSKWIGHMVADCSGLFKWAFRQLGGDMYHGSNTMYNSYCTAKGKLSKGKRTDGYELLPGTAVFTWNEDKQKYVHVGLYVGNGEVIEAKGTIAGVVKSKVSEKRWTNWGWLKGMEGGESMPDTTEPILRRGDKGEWVTKLQTMLVQRGYDIGKSGIDGDFGRATESAVRQFQRDWGLKEDGIVGKNTWGMLTTAPTSVFYTVTIPSLTLDQANALTQQYPGSTKEVQRG